MTSTIYICMYVVSIILCPPRSYYTPACQLNVHHTLLSVLCVGFDSCPPSVPLLDFLQIFPHYYSFLGELCCDKQ